MRKAIYLISAMLIVIAAFLTLLVSLTNRKGYDKSGFTRLFSTEKKLEVLYHIEVNKELKALCGSSSNQLYFLSNDPRKIYVYDYSMILKDSIVIPAKLPELALYGYDVFADSANVIIFFRNLSSALFYSLNNNIGYTINFEPPIFTRVVPISNNSVAMRALDKSRTKQLFQKLNTQTGKIISQLEPFNTQYDAGFSTDGELLYDTLAHRLVYLQFYQNKFYCMDSSLNLLYVGNTIDTTNTSLVSTKKILNTKGNGSLMPSSPLKVINKSAAIHFGKLHVLSTLKADNEKKEDFDKYSVIDVYNISNGRYLNSFYIEALTNEKIKKINIVKNLLITFSEHSIVFYKLTSKQTN